MDSTLSHFGYIARAAALAAGLAAAAPALALNHEVTVNPISPGRFTVACSNLEMDTSRMVAGAVPADYWEGKVVEGRARYLSELLVHPQSAIRVDAPVPDNRTLYPGNAGDRVEHVAIVCHPTPRTNTDPDYALPATTDVVPKMLPPGQQPRLLGWSEYLETLGVAISPGPPPGLARLPLIVYSHGLSGSPIGKGYINVMTQLAAQGYVVAAIFHGDPRFSRVRLEDFSDYFYALTNFDRIVEMMLMRPVSLKAMTDVILASGYGAGIDAEKIGGFGASMGGQAMAHLLGARISATLAKNCRDPVTDPRIKAAFAYVPYSGQSWLPAFCDDQRGAENVTRPFFAMTGSFDTTAPEGLTEQAVNRMKGTRYMVSLAGGEHELRTEDAGDVFTWMITFFNAYLQPPSLDPAAMARLIRMARVSGGRFDSLVVDVHVPTSFNAAINESPVREFYNTDLDHYFIAAWQGEVDIILSGGAGQGWVLTNESFKAHNLAPPPALMGGEPISPVCRFYGRPAGGPNSHFFTASPDSCEAVKSMGGWYYEGIGFHVRSLTQTGACPPGQLQVNRAYNGRWRENDSNHRYTTSDSTLREMARRGWFVEGTAWCSPP